MEDFFISDDEEGMAILSKQIYDCVTDGEVREMVRNNRDLDNKNKLKQIKEGLEDNIDQNFILKRALLKDSNMEMVKKIEIDYF